MKLSLALLMLLSCHLWAQESFEVKELTKEQMTKLDAARDKAAKVNAELLAVENSIKKEFGWSPPAWTVNAGCFSSSADFQIRGHYLLITKTTRYVCGGPSE